MCPVKNKREREKTMPFPLDPDPSQLREQCFCQRQTKRCSGNIPCIRTVVINIRLSIIFIIGTTTGTCCPLLRQESGFIYETVYS